MYISNAKIKGALCDMRIVWLCNVILPAIAEQINQNTSFGGGWLITTSNQLAAINEIVLTICCPHNGQIEMGKVNSVQYCLFNESTTDNIDAFSQLLVNEKPDIIHIFGTEFKHSYDMVKAAQKVGISDKIVISIQGLVSVIAKHYTLGLKLKDIYSFTLRDLVRHDNIYLRKRQFEKRGQYEIDAIKSVKYIIGRTDWDECCVKTINPTVNIYKCNETLRSAFYKTTWDYGKCEKHSIFVSQCTYPVKGFHLFLDIFPTILQMFPDAKIYTTGLSPFTESGTIKKGLTYYKVLLAKKIKMSQLEDKVVFLGNLDEKEMCNQYLRSNVFISCSTIENSPNSVGEAMLLGMPVISSDVGGVKNLLEHGKEGFLYPSDEPYMIPYYVKKCFEYNESIAEMNSNARKHALLTHDADVNLNCLLDVYKSINNNFD